MQPLWRTWQATSWTTQTACTEHYALFAVRLASTSNAARYSGAEAQATLWKGRILPRSVKITLLAVLLIAAALAFGIMCRRMAVAYRLLLPPWRPFLRLLLLLWLSMLAMAVTAGMVAVLFRPQWVAYLTFALSGLALLAGWGWAPSHLALTMLYIGAGALFAALTQRDLQQRVRFSVRSVGENWRVLMIVLLVLSVASFYLGFAEHVRSEGLSLPERQVEDLTAEVAQEVVSATPISRLELIRDEGVRQVQRVLRGMLERQLRRVERYIPPFTAIVFFVLLLAVVWLSSCVPMLILAVLLPLLTALGVAKWTVETFEVQRLAID